MKKFKLLIFSFLLVSPLFFSCTKLLDVKPEEVLLKKDYLGKDKLDARAALFGVLSQMQDISTQYIILGELRGDLMDVTADAVDELRQVNQHNLSANNSFADPGKFYSMINNCNFALKYIDTLAYDNGLLPIYVSILRIRTWAYLQLAVTYGSVPYITEPIESSADLNKEYPLLTFAQMMETLTSELLPYSLTDNVSTYENSLGFVLYNLIPDKDILMGDLYNWKNDYVNSAISYKLFLDRNVNGGAAKYNLTSPTSSTSGTYGVIYSISNFVYAITNNWPNIFLPAVQPNEAVTYIPFTKQYRQSNKGYSILTKQVKSSMAAERNWEKQFKIFNNVLFDSLDNRAKVVDASGMILKYQYNYLLLTRAASVYIRLAEVVNRAGYPEHALSIINKGVKDDAVTVGAPRFINNTDGFLNFVQNKYYTVSSSGVASGGNVGVRGRVGMAPVSVSAFITHDDSVKQVELLILNEAALESAFEGTRWQDLLRIASRNNDPSILADAVSNKFTLAGDNAIAATVHTKLMDPANWYLPLNKQANFVTVPLK